jgi:hypothetical protein
MPEQLYHVDGNVVRFPSNEDRHEEDIVIKYYPKSSAALK